MPWRDVAVFVATLAATLTRVAAGRDDTPTEG
jgi:hypothetical protein